MNIFFLLFFGIALLTAGDEGTGIDPHGLAAFRDEGCGIDPNGRCVTTLGGGAMDPNGSEASPCVDPYGGCGRTGALRDDGPYIDPNGGRVSATADDGRGIDPNG